MSDKSREWALWTALDSNTKDVFLVCPYPGSFPLASPRGPQVFGVRIDWFKEIRILEMRDLERWARLRMRRNRDLF